MLEHIVLITPAPIHLLEFLRATARIVQINLDISEIITVYFRKEKYDVYLGRNAEAARGAPGERSSRGTNAAQPDNSGAVGQKLSRTLLRTYRVGRTS